MLRTSVGSPVVHKGAVRVNDFAIKLANVNGTGSASANGLLMQAIFRMGIPVSGKNLFPSNIQGLPTWYEIRVNKDGYTARALDYGKHGIRSNALAPMGAVTDLNRDLLADPAVMSALEAALPSGRLATPDEIAAAAVWLCSDDAAYVNAAEIVVDGGESVIG